MAGIGMQGTQLADGPMIDSVTTVADVQTILHRLLGRIIAIEGEVVTNAHGAEQQLASIRVDVRTLQLAPPPSPHGHGKRFDLIDSKTMSPAMFSGARTENFKAWAKKIKAYTNNKLPGYRQALEATEKLGKDVQVDMGVKVSWSWDDVDEADSRLHEMLLLITSGEAIGIVESVPNRGFEAWRLLSVRYNSVGEMYTFDKMNAIMKQSPAKNIAELPASIAKFERDLKTFRERTNTEFPEVLKLPILIQMIPMAWKKEFETTFRQPGADRTYEGLVAQLLAIGNEERYMSNRLGPNDMETDNLERNRYWDDPEAITPKMYEGAEPQREHQREREYSEAEWSEWQSYIEQEIDYLGKSGKGGKGGKGSKGYGGGGKGYGAKGGSQSYKGRDDWKPQDAKDVICLWCHVKGHFRKDCKELAAYKIKRDAERAAKGDHSVYVNPRAGKGQSPVRGAGSLDDDYTEEVVGLMGDIDAAALDEVTDTAQNKLLQEIEDFEEADDDKDIQDEDDWEPICGIVENDSGVFVHHDPCECCPAAVLSEEEMMITPERRHNEWRAVSSSTPLADLFENQKLEDPRSSTPIVCLPGSSTNNIA